MISTVPRNPIDFDDPAAVRRLARIISAAIVIGAAAFAAVVNMTPEAEPASKAPAGHPLYTPFVVAAAALVLVGAFTGSRMHTVQGSIAERGRKTLALHVVSLALAEAATFLGLVLVLLTRSWEVVLPAAIGFAGLVTSAIRGEFRFSRLAAEAPEAS